jgi:hypothetical protein
LWGSQPALILTANGRKAAIHLADVRTSAKLRLRSGIGLSELSNKQTIRRYRKSVCTVNLQQELANFLVGICDLSESRSNIQIIRGTLGQSNMYGFCHEPTNARFVAEVDMQLLS